MTSDRPFWDLFEQLREAGMKLTLEQYDLLQQALQQGYGLKGWADLKQVCQVLWVKPSLDYDRATFERIFDHYVIMHRQHLQPFLSSPPPSQHLRPLERPLRSPTPSASSSPPQPPASQPPDSTAPQAPIAIRTTVPTLPRPRKASWILSPSALPLSLSTLQQSWRSLRRPVRVGLPTEVDLDATLSQIKQDGLFSQIVLRPALRQRGELLVLIDDSDAMLPFHPALHPLVTAITDRRIAPASLYRFTVYPEDYLYDWAQPAKALPLARVLSQLHRNRTIALIISDGGAASHTNNADRCRGIAKFLDQLVPCLCHLLWINPLPADRWQGTSAAAIAQTLMGRMIPLDAAQLRAASQTLPTELMIPLWTLVSPTPSNPSKRI